jgi:hypothetical protein
VRERGGVRGVWCGRVVSCLVFRSYAVCRVPCVMCHVLYLVCSVWCEALAECLRGCCVTAAWLLRDCCVTAA